MVELCEKCKNYARGCLVNDPVSTDNEPATNFACKHASCPIGEIAAINALRALKFNSALAISISIHTGEQIIVVPYNSKEKHGDGIIYQRYVDIVTHNLFSIGPNGLIYFTGQNLNLRGTP